MSNIDSDGPEKTSNFIPRRIQKYQPSQRGERQEGRSAPRKLHLDTFDDRGLHNYDVEYSLRLMTQCPMLNATENAEK